MPIYVHVNSHVIRANIKNEVKEPPITIIRGKTRTRHMSVKIIGSSEMVYRPDKPLSGGARIWLICEEAVGD